MDTIVPVGERVRLVARVHRRVTTATWHAVMPEWVTPRSEAEGVRRACLWTVVEVMQEAKWTTAGEGDVCDGMLLAPRTTPGAGTRVVRVGCHAIVMILTLTHRYLPLPGYQNQV